MGDDLCSSIVCALIVIYNPASAATVRCEAETFLERIKNDKGSVEVAFQLFEKSGNTEPQTQNYCLQVIDRQIHVNWASFSPTEKAAVRVRLMGLLTNASVAASVSFVKTKLASVLVSVLEKDWPSEWSDFFPSLEQLVSTTPHPIPVQSTTLPPFELSQHLFQRLSDNIGHSMTSLLLSDRRKELCSGVNSLLPAILQYTESRWSSSLPPDFVHLILSTLTSLVEWVNLNSFLSCGRSLLDRCLACLQSPEFSEDAAQFFMALLQRKADDSSSTLFLDVSQSFFSFCLSQNLLTFDVSRYEVVKRLTCCFVDSLLTCLPFMKKPTDYLNYSISFYIEILEQRSAMVCSLTFDFWIRFISNPLAAQSILPFLAQRLCTALQKTSLRSSSPSVETVFGPIDFESEEEWQYFFNQQRSKIRPILALLVANYSNELMRSLNDHFLRSIQEFAPANSGSNPMVEVPLLFPVSLQIVWESLSFYMESCFSHPPGSFPSADQKAVLLSMISSLFPLRNPVVQENLLSCIKSLSFILGDQPELLKSVIQYAMSVSQVKELPGGSKLDYIVSQPLISCRHASLELLVHLGHLHPLPIAAIEGQLFQALSVLEFTPSEETILVQLMISVSNSIPFGAQRVAYIQKILEGTIRSWNTFADTLESPQSFLQMMDLTSFVFVNGCPAMSSTRLLELNAVVTRFLVIVKEMKQMVDGSTAIDPFLTMILPSLFSLMKVLHLLFSAACPQTGVLASVPEEKHNVLRSMIGYSRKELTAYLNRPNDSTTPNTIPDVLCNYFTKLRLSLYQTVGEIIRNNPALFFGLPNIGVLMNESVISMVPFIQFRHLCILLSEILIPYTILCTPELLPQLLPSICPTLGQITERLDNAFIRNTIDDALPPGLSADEAEILNDTLRSLLSVSLFEFYMYITGLKWTGAVKSIKDSRLLSEAERNELVQVRQHDSKTRSNTLLKTLFDSCPEMHRVVITGLLKSIQWKDVVSLSKSLTIIDRLIPYVASKSNLVQLYAVPLFSECLKGLIYLDFESSIQFRIVQLISVMYSWFSMGISPFSKDININRTYVSKTDLIDKWLVSDFGVSKKEISTFRNSFSCLVSEKSQRRLVKDFLQSLKSRIIHERKMENKNEVLVKREHRSGPVQNRNSKKNRKKGGHTPSTPPPAIRDIFDDL